MNLEDDNLDIKLIKDLDRESEEIQKSYHNLTQKTFHPKTTIDSHIGKDGNIARFAIVKNEEILSVVSMFGVFEWFDNKIIKIGGIGGVVTHPEYYRKGLANVLLKKSIDLLLDTGVDIIFLYGPDIGLWTSDWYIRNGFIPLKNKYQYLDKNNNIHQEHNGYIHPGKTNEVFNLIQESQSLLTLSHGRW